MTDEIFWKHPDAIVSCEWLNKNINDPGIRIYDCTTYLHYRDKDPSLAYIVESGKEKYDLSHIQIQVFWTFNFNYLTKTVHIDLHYLS